MNVDINFFARKKTFNVYRERNQVRIDLMEDLPVTFSSVFFVYIQCHNWVESVFVVHTKNSHFCLKRP